MPLLRPDNATMEAILQRAIQEQDADLGINLLNQELDRLERRARVMVGKKGPFTYGNGNKIKVTIEIDASPAAASKLAYMDDDVCFFGVNTDIEEHLDAQHELGGEPGKEGAKSLGA
ncbi:MAG: hypothetical protein P9L99_13405 [Candidatus Lernaella stagnicola]|nr:hypothetical protein [Candidatus Lernaella stagnicola]